MVKMRALRAHSSTLWGSPVDGEVFDVPEGYVKEIEDSGLAKRVSAPVAVEPVHEVIKEAAREGAREGIEATRNAGLEPAAPSVNDTIRDLQATVQPKPITSEQVSTGKRRRGRPRKS